MKPNVFLINYLFDPLVGYVNVCGSYVAMPLIENCMLSKRTCTTAGTLQTLQVQLIR